MCSPMRRSDKESLLLERQLSGAVKQHKSAPALDYCFPSAQLGVPSRSGGPYARRGRRTQIPTLKESYTLKTPRFLPLTPPWPFLPCLDVMTETFPLAAAPSPVRAHGPFPLQGFDFI